MSSFVKVWREVSSFGWTGMSLLLNTSGKRCIVLERSGQR